MLIKISSWNVNGIRSVLSKGFIDYLKKDSPDILCLQEVKAFRKDFEHLLTSIMDEYELFINSAERPGYSGTATFIKKKLGIKVIKYSTESSIEELDREGRFQHFVTDKFELINCYYPNGKDDHSRVPLKLEFSFNVLDRAIEIKKSKAVILTGDFNIAHQEIDLKNPKSNKYTTGFLNIEREFIDQMVENGMVDSFRFKNDNLIDAYSWWSYRNGAREKNVGWRLDYIFVNEEVKNKILAAEIKSKVFGSDHCPVHLEIEL